MLSVRMGAFGFLVWATIGAVGCMGRVELEPEEFDAGMGGSASFHAGGGVASRFLIRAIATVVLQGH